LSIEDLRAIVADKVTEEQLSTYKIYAECGIRGYEFIHRIHSVEDLKEKIKIASEFILKSIILSTYPESLPASKKKNDVIWADAFAVQTLSDYFHVSFLIINEGRQISTTIIKPEQNNEKFIILELTRREHYNLVSINKSSVFNEDELPDPVKRTFGIKCSATNDGGTQLENQEQTTQKRKGEEDIEIYTKKSKSWEVRVNFIIYY
jgi:hypothetical protein